MVQRFHVLLWPHAEGPERKPVPMYGAEFANGYVHEALLIQTSGLDGGGRWYKQQTQTQQPT